MEQLKRIIPSQILELSCNSAETPEQRQERIAKQKCEMMNKTKGNLNEIDGYDCPLCNNRGGHYEAQLHNGFWYETFVYCKCRKIRNALSRLKQSGLKEVVHKYTFDNFEATEPWQQALKKASMDYCTNGNGKWLFIGGQSGCGKTHLCTAVAIKLLKKGYQTKYMLWREEAVKLKAAVNDAEEYSKMITEIKEAEVLYIDDLFKTGKDADGRTQQPTPADINLAFEIINHRYNNKKLFTIISSECSLTDILNIDEAIGGRIAEMAVEHGYGFSVKNDKKRNYRLRNICEL